MEKRIVDRWLAALGEKVGLPKLALDEDEIANLALEGIPMSFFFDAENSCLALQALLGVLPTSAAMRHRLLCELLSANYLGVETDGATLAVDSNWKLISLQKSWALRPEARIEAFLDDIACFLQVACLWQTRSDVESQSPDPSGSSLRV